MERRRIARYVRIAISAMSVTACVLLIALWVRSFAYVDIFVWRFADWKHLLAESDGGELSARVADTSMKWSRSRSWYLNSTPMKRIEERQSRLAVLGQQSARGRPRFLLGDNYFVIPHWFTALLFGIFAALAVSPWIKWRFSLRTLLIAMTLVAFGIGAIVYVAR